MGLGAGGLFRFRRDRTIYGDGLSDIVSILNQSSLVRWNIINANRVPLYMEGFMKRLGARVYDRVGKRLAIAAYRKLLLPSRSGDGMELQYSLIFFLLALYHYHSS